MGLHQCQTRLRLGHESMDVGAHFQGRRMTTALRKKRDKRAAERAKNFPHLAIPFKPREIDEDYLDFIRGEPCIVTRQHGVDPAHTHTVGSGGSDYDALPLKRDLHTEQHKGFDTFAEKYRLNYQELIQKHNDKYERQTGNKIKRG